MNETLTETTTHDDQTHVAIGIAEVADAQPDMPGRRMVAVSDLIAHPGNVRDDLHLTEEFLASIAGQGVRIPLLITPAGDGGWRVIEGHRRLAAAVKAGLAEVPCDIDQERADDEAGQYLDMLIANSDSYRTNYTVTEEAAALFAAHEAGASRTRIRKATGRTTTEVKMALTVGRLSPETRTAAAQACAEVTLDDLALMAEFDGDQAATDRLLTCLEHGYPLEHAAQRIRQDQAEAAQHQQLRASLQASGISVTDILPADAAWLTSLTHDGHDLTPDTHAACPGHGATFQRWNQLEPAYYCTSPADHGHASRWALTTASPDTGSDTTTDGGTTSRLAPAPDPDRRLVINGNKAWQAAADVRHRWLTITLFPRRTVPREAQAFLARQLLTMPDPLRSGLSTAHAKQLFTTLTGRPAHEWETECDTATPGRLLVLMFAPVITAYEHAMTEAEGRNTWRTDRYSPCPHPQAAHYLTFLSTLGYHLSDIEQAVANNTPYTDTPAPPETEGTTGQPDSFAPDADRAEVDEAIDPAA